MIMGAGAAGFEVRIERLDVAADAARSAAEAVATAGPDAPLAAAAGALPGSTAAVLADLVAARWTTATTGWARLAGEYADDLGTAAAAYRLSDDDARAAFAELDRFAR